MESTSKKTAARVMSFGWLAVAALVMTSLGVERALSAEAPAGEIDALLKGVNAVAAPGVPGTVCVFGEQAYGVVDGPAGGGGKKKQALRVAVVGAAKVGKGHVLAFGHDGYLKPAALKEGDTLALLVNAVKLCGKEKPRAGAVGMRGIVAALKEKGIEAEDISLNKWIDALQVGKLDAILLPSNSPANDTEAAALRKFVEGGGVAVLAATGWGWNMNHDGKAIAEDFPPNRMLIGMGLLFATGLSGADTATKEITITKPVPAMLHVGKAVDLLGASAGKGAGAAAGKNVAADDLAQATATVLAASGDLPATAAPMKKLHELTAAPGLAMPTLAKPLKQADGLARVALVMGIRNMAGLAPDKITASPAAANFPGAVPADAPRVEKTIAIDTRTPRWHSTGLYAAPGQAIGVSVPEAAAGKKLRVRIGAHTDKTYHLAAWHRPPEISRAFAIEKTATAAANAFGGMIYIEVPGNCDLGTIDVKISNAVEAPLFILGKTSVEEWRNRIRGRPAPWAEVGTDKLIITLRSDAIRKLDDPTPILQHWNKVLDADATLAGWPLERKSPERMVSDADISAGYMHSGYPIMTGLDVTDAFVDMPKLLSLNSSWGFYHELGHNHQSGDWTFDGTTEVTVNLFSMYVLETVCGHTKEESTSRALKDSAKIKKYLAAPNFETWKADPFLALAMYAQMRNEFGWEPYKKVFAEYRALSADQHPKGEMEKHDQWMVRMSKATGKNLGPFFQAWGIPTSEVARKSVEGLGEWKF